MDGGVSIRYRMIGKPYIQKVYPMVHIDVEKDFIYDNKILAFDPEQIDILIESDTLAKTLNHSNNRSSGEIHRWHGIPIMVRPLCAGSKNRNIRYL